MTKKTDARQSGSGKATDKAPSSGWEFWIDRGGTFTDVVARRPDGHIVTHKLLSENPELYGDAALQGIRDTLGLNASDQIPAEAILVQLFTRVQVIVHDFELQGVAHHRKSHM